MERFQKKQKQFYINYYRKYDTIISKGYNDLGQTNLIKIHIATRPDAAPVAAQAYTLALKHHDFLKQEIKNLLDAEIIPQIMSQWACPIVVVKHTPEVSPQQFHVCIDYRKIKSLLLTVTSAMGTKKGTFCTYSPAENWQIICIFKRGKIFHSTWNSAVVTTT